MQERCRHSHHRYINAEENFSQSKAGVIEVLVSKGVFHQWSINGHIDHPFDPNIYCESVVLEGKTQPYIQYNDIL